MYDQIIPYLNELHSLNLEPWRANVRQTGAELNFERHRASTNRTPWRKPGVLASWELTITTSSAMEWSSGPRRRGKLKLQS